DPNVRAEAANSLSMYGEEAVLHLVKTFQQDQHWLVRRSILAVLVEMQNPQAVFDVCIVALSGEDLTVQEAGIDGLAVLANSSKQAEALEQLIKLLNSEEWRIRMQVASALKRFDQPQAKKAISSLRKDEDHRVVAAALEASL
ncbi:MAG: HEAT repeat domain-containing protein, partial [Coleofasciculaceae cyanobacterium]